MSEETKQVQELRKAYNDLTPFDKYRSLRDQVNTDLKYGPDEDCPSMAVFDKMLTRSFKQLAVLKEAALEAMPCDYCATDDVEPHEEEVQGHCEKCCKALCENCISPEVLGYHKHCAPSEDNGREAF